MGRRGWIQNMHQASVIPLGPVHNLLKLNALSNSILAVWPGVKRLKRFLAGKYNPSGARKK
jgi:hypothetical protein